MRRLMMAGLVALGALGPGCDEGNTGQQAQTGAFSAVEPPGACAPHHGAEFVPVGPAHSSSVALVRTPQGKTIAIVADEDERALHSVDPESLEELAVTELDGAPSHVLPLPDGRIAVTLRDKAEVQVFEPSAGLARPLERRCSAEVAAEPIAMAWAGNSERLVVTSGWGQALTVLSGAGLDVERIVSLAREPRAVVLSQDEHTAFVSHAVGGQLSAVDMLNADGATSIDIRVDVRDVPFNQTQDATPRHSNQGFALVSTRVTDSGAMRLLAPHVSVDPGSLTQPITAGGYGSAAEFGPRITAPHVAVVDPVTNKPLLSNLLTKRSDRDSDCMLPRAAATHGDVLLLACAGIDAVLELDARAAEPIVNERRRYDVPAGPTGLAIEQDGKRAVVWSQLSRTVSTIDFEEVPSEAVAQRTLVRRRDSAMTAKLARGRLLFHTTQDARISEGGRACASCHPDGREDGLVWSSPDGPRQTVMLAGRIADTAPYGWFGENATLEAHVKDTFARLGGSGFEHPSQRPDLEALLAYVESLPRPPTTNHADLELVARGKALFEDEVQGCATCHTDGGTDGRAYDVGSGNQRERQRSFDTPSLLAVSGTAPYFHDGRYATLQELLIATDGAMGHTSTLGADDRRALTTYLETL